MVSVEPFIFHHWRVIYMARSISDVFRGLSLMEFDWVFRKYSQWSIWCIISKSSVLQAKLHKAGEVTTLLKNSQWKWSKKIQILFPNVSLNSSVSVWKGHFLYVLGGWVCEYCSIFQSLQEMQIQPDWIHFLSSHCSIFTCLTRFPACFTNHSSALCNTLSHTSPESLPFSAFEDSDVWHHVFKSLPRTLRDNSPMFSMKIHYDQHAGITHTHTHTHEVHHKTHLRGNSLHKHGDRSCCNNM